MRLLRFVANQEPALKGESEGRSPVIVAAACTNCARCIDVCSKDVFEFGSRFHRPPSKVIPLTVHQEAP